MGTLSTHSCWHAGDMGWGIYKSDLVRNHDFDPYRDAIATASENGVIVGYFATEVNEVWLFAGWRRFRPVWKLSESLDSWLVLESGPNAPYEDPDFVRPSDLEDGFYRRSMRGGPYELSWSTGPGRDALWSKYQRDWG